MPQSLNLRPQHRIRWVLPIRFRNYPRRDWRGRRRRNRWLPALKWSRTLSASIRGMELRTPLPTA